MRNNKIMERFYRDDAIEPYYEAFMNDLEDTMDPPFDEIIQYEVELYIDEQRRKDGLAPFYVVSFDDYHGFVPEYHEKRVFEREQVDFFTRLFYWNLVLTFGVTTYAYIIREKNIPLLFFEGILLSVLSVYLIAFFLVERR